ncbi:Endonuclease/exonuclease/phosphatase [Parasponia andersonii]|uniref:Endonuclease/exonuclease/phosphatase n=1 Tax=Parasponia andersonii TaxID=3476 RepID=A0A2P5C9X0_PARAD|nr:Endonuclease/exonuclease/phosphatase [Parasponia andersonii]
MGAHETTGIIKRRSCEDFRAGVTLCNLLDLETQGPSYTWHGTRGGWIVMSRLDRTFCNDAFLEHWSQVSSIYLPRLSSDHHLLLLSSSMNTSTSPRPFRFQGMWLLHSNFKDFVRNVWCRPCVSSPMSILTVKLKDLKRELKVWNWQVFGELKLNISKASEKVLSIQERLTN